MDTPTPPPPPDTQDAAPGRTAGGDGCGRAERRRTLALLAGMPLAALLPGCAGVAPPAAAGSAEAAAGEVHTPPPALRVEGLPPLPAHIVRRSRPWGEVQGHGFVAWHPQRLEMLVTHRPPGSSTTQLFLLRDALGALQPLTEGADPVTTADWEPRDGRYAVFARGRGGDEAFQLFRLDPATRAVEQITPDGQRHALVDWIPGHGLLLGASVPLDRTAEGGRRAEIGTTLWVMDPERPAMRRVLAELPGGGWFGGSVSPDGRLLALTRYMSAVRSEVWLFELGDPAALLAQAPGSAPAAALPRRRVLPAPGEPVNSSHLAAGFSPDGRQLLFRSDRAGEFEEAMRLDLASGAITRLTGHIPWDVEGGSASEGRDAGRWLALRVNVDGRDELRLFDAASGREIALPPGAVPEGSITNLAFHPAGGPLAVVVTSSRGPGQIHALDIGAVVAGGATPRPVPWTRAVVPPGLDTAALPEQRVVRWKSFDGRTISGLLSLPPARFAGRRPVLMLVHGGPEAQAKAGWLGRFNYLLQERGVAVLQPNVRGSTGYGKTFVNLDNGVLREDSVRDLGAALDWIATQPQLDGARVVVMGGSYGGYMALASSVLLADRIAGAVSTVGISNFISFLQNTETYRRDLRRVEYGDERDPQMRAFLERISPLNHVDRIRRPLLVVQGRNDPRVPWTESEQIVRALQARNLPVGYLLADNEGHGFARRENAEYYFGAVVQFLQRTVGA